MKIAVVCQYFYPEQFRVNDICFELVKDGHEVTVLTGLPNYPSGVVDDKYNHFNNQDEVINGVRVIRSWLLGRGKGIKQLALNYLTFAVSATLKSLFIKKDFDLIMVYQLSPVTMALPGILLKKMLSKPLIIYCHDLWPESIVSAGTSTNSTLYGIVLKLSQWIYSSADVIFTSSKLFEKYFDATFVLKSPIIHLPVYAETLFENIDNTPRQDDIVNLVFAGNIGEMQSVETIIEAAHELKNDDKIKFHIIGDGSSRYKCEEIATRLGLSNVVFYGQYPVKEMPRFYEMADAFLVTLKANEAISYTLPNKVQSYMAAGKPIIGAINGETQIVIRESRCGLCSTAENAMELACNIRKFANEKEMHSVWGANAKRYYNDHFSKKAYMQKLNFLLNAICHSGAQTPN